MATALRGKKPTAVQKRLKALFFGPAGVGKTTAAIQFPAPYLIDTERGAENDQYVRLLNERGGAIFQTSDPDELIAEITSLLSTKHDYKTLIIDPLTVIYSDLLDKSAKVLATREDPTGTAFSRHKGPADRKIKHMINLLLRLDMNVIITSHEKAEWKDGKPTGTGTFDCYGKLDYLFDLVFMIQQRGTERTAIVKKTRVEGFPLGEVFPFSYNEVANRYGRDVLESSSTPTVLASKEQVMELNRLIDVIKLENETVEKWLEKAGAETLSELSSEQIDKCIAFCRGRVAPVTANA